MNRLFAGIFSAGMLLSSMAMLSFAAPNAMDVYDPNPLNEKKSRHINIHADKDNNGLSDGLQRRMSAMAAGDFVDVIVTFNGLSKGQSSSSAARQVIGYFDLHREFTLIHGFKATMTVQQAQALSRAPGVFRVQEDATVTTQLSGAASDFGAIAARETANVNGSGVGICIVDTGIDITHEQFAGRSIGFYDAINGLAASYDDHGHGTHVAAIALGGGGTGSNADIKGIAPAASIFSAKVLNAQGSGSESQVLDGIQFCASQADVHIISMSLGTVEASDGLDAMSLAVNCASDPAFSQICNITPDSPKIAVVAAGNSGPAPETVGSPGAAEKAITVGAVSNWSEDGKGVYLAAFSSRGPNLAGLLKPDISAPGLRILSAKAGVSDGYVSYSGTSMATPFTSGAIALLLHKNPALRGDVETVRSLLVDSAQDRGMLDAGSNPIKPDNEYGAGLLDVGRAVAMANGGDAIPAAFPTYHREQGRINGNGGSQFFGPFTLTEADITAGIPLAATVTIEGSSYCPYDVILPGYCDLLGAGWEWDPDLDVYLLDDQGNIVSGGSGDITVSECALSGEACGVSRQETIYYQPPSIFTSAAGDYWIEVRSYAGGGDFLLEVSRGPLTGTTPTNSTPIASFVESCTDLICNFTDTSTDSDGRIVSWNWDFGNEFNSTEQHPSYDFLLSGTYTVSLQVTDDKGATNSTSHDVTVSSNNTPPIANAGGPYEAIIAKGKNVAVTLDGSASTDADGAIVSWIWSQNGQQIASGETAAVNFKEGIYTVRLTVIDNDGLEGSDETTVTVTKSSDGDSGGGSGVDCSAKPNHPQCR